MVLHIGPLHICVQIEKRPLRARGQRRERPVQMRADPERFLEESRRKALLLGAGRIW